MMTPGEKAKELVSRFYYSLPNNGYLDEGINSCDSRWKESITAALITVDEILTARNSEQSFLVKGLTLKYWQEIKEQIQRL